MVDELPTLTDIYENAIGSPALGELPGVGELLATGRLDALDSVGRMAPSVIGFAYNTRLLLDGFAGEPDETDGGLNPFGHPAQENLTLLLLDAHRMLSIAGPQGSHTQVDALLGIPAFVKLFRDAFPEEAAEAGATAALQFTNPRGPGYPPGLGLSRRDVKDLTDVIENALYDPAFVHFDPSSTTDMFQLSERDVTYSVYRPDLAALGAVDGLPLSGLAEDNNDPLSRRDQGLEFLDVSGQLDIKQIGSRSRGGHRLEDVYKITNNSASVVDTHLLIVVQGLSDRTRLVNASGISSDGYPYLREFLDDGVLQPGQSMVTRLRFRQQSSSAPLNYNLVFLSGQGNP
jgi:hypothetical protein